ncbi:hypothetical protein AYO38_02110 [bacterium SCGC AG-212-C10]|nr:hypothetical protein AYO38_02110 [bacterium SCGC AG-212-C10]
MHKSSTLALFTFVVVLTGFAISAVWPSDPNRYLPGDFWPQGRGLKIGNWERETMRLGLDLRGGAFLVLQAEVPDDYEGNVGEALDVTVDVIERRVNSTGVSEPEIQKASGNRIQVSVPGLTLEEARQKVGKTAALAFMSVNDAGQLVPATGIIDGEEVAMTGQYLKNNTFASRIGTTYAVNFETTSTGAKLMGQITAKALSYQESDPRRQLIIQLDGETISQATVQGQITDQGQITGQPSFGASNDLSKQLNAGALPLPLTIIQSQEVSATLGEDSVLESVHAGQVGLLAVALFMILYYRLPGFLAAMALGVYTSLTLLAFKVVPVTLTLSGIAAFVLSVGMAVDANILIFERMKEELRRGRTLNAAIDIGFRRAWTSIRDSNVSTLLTCIILYWFGNQFGASVVKGFALTLAVGVLISMFSAITVTRTFLKMIVGTRLAKNHWLFNADEQKHTRLPSRGGAIETGGGK